MMDHLGDAIQGVVNLLDMLGSTVRRMFGGSKRSAMEEWRSTDNTWVGVAVLLVMGLCMVFLISCGRSLETDEQPAHPAADTTVARPPVALEEPSQANTIAREVIAGNISARLDEVLVQSMIDSLSSHLPAIRIMQAKAITRIWGRCDGAAAESVGLACFEHVSERPAEFFGLFPKEIPDQEMPIWADMIAQELLIDNQEDPTKAIDAFATELRLKCREQGAPQDAAIERFRLQVRSRLDDLTPEH